MQKDSFNAMEAESGYEYRGGGGVYSDGNKSAEIEFYSLAAHLGIYVYVHVYVYV